MSPWLFPLVAQSRLAQLFYLRDVSHIPDLIVYQHELCYSEAAATFKQVPVAATQQLLTADPEGFHVKVPLEKLERMGRATS